MKPSREETAQWLKRRVAAIKAEKGLNWGDIAARMTTAQHPVSASSLMSKHSRSSFTATELIALMQALGISSLEIPPADHH
jgi:hypothetical protein